MRVVVRRRRLRRARLAQQGLAAGAVCVRARLIGIAAMDNWDLAMDTLSQVLVAVTISVCLAIPIGIWCGRSTWSRQLLRPLLDTAQVLPQFVYLVPVVFLFNVGRCPGVIAAVIYAVPPGIRLVSLGSEGSAVHAARSGDLVRGDPAPGADQGAAAAGLQVDHARASTR